MDDFEVAIDEVLNPKVKVDGEYHFSRSMLRSGEYYYVGSRWGLKIITRDRLIKYAEELREEHSNSDYDEYDDRYYEGFEERWGEHNDFNDALNEIDYFRNKIYHIKGCGENGGRLEEIDFRLDMLKGGEYYYYGGEIMHRSDLFREGELRLRESFDSEYVVLHDLNDALRYVYGKVYALKMPTKSIEYVARMSGE